MSDDELAMLIAQCVVIYQKPYIEDTARIIWRLHSFDVLSAQAISAIVGVSQYAVRRAVGPEIGHIRGTLNPKHLQELAYCVSFHDIRPDRLRYMLATGTTLEQIARLTNISTATLKRRKNDV